MKRKTCVAGAIALALLPCQATAQEMNGTTSFVANPYIEKITCDEGSGTGFKISTGQWVSVNHVTSLGKCRVDGVPIVVTYADPLGDVSTFVVPGDHRKGGIPVDCSGYQDQQWYHGQGHGLGLPIISSVPVMYSRWLNLEPNFRGWAILAYNRFIHGQSGGPVLNRWGAATGTVNARGNENNISASKPLKDTIICKGG